MDFVFRHCTKVTTGVRYRVTSQEGGVLLLDMIVCHSCSEQAKNLGLDVKEIDQAVTESRVCCVPKSR